jgi:hypothetical protein
MYDLDMNVDLDLDFDMNMDVWTEADNYFYLQCGQRHHVLRIALAVHLRIVVMVLTIHGFPTFPPVL